MGEKTLDEKFANLEKFLEDYREKYHLDKIKITEVDIAVNIPEIKKMHPEDIGQLVLEWGLYSFSLQIQINDLEGKLVWVESNLNRYWGINQQYISKEFGFTAHDRSMLMLENDDYCEKLYTLKRDIQIKLSQLKYIPAKVEFLIKIGEQIMKSKFGELYGNRRS